MREKTHAHYHLNDSVTNEDKSRRLNELNLIFKENKRSYLSEYLNQNIIALCLDVGRSGELICMSLNGINVVVKNQDLLNDIDKENKCVYDSIEIE